MKKRLSLVLAIFMVLSLCACSSPFSTVQPGGQADEQGSNPDEQKSATAKTVKYDSYQAILDDYTVKLQNATPGLIEEYKSEAANNNDGLEGLATICNAKVAELAKISNDGVSEMAKYYYEHGNGSYDEYSQWAGKLLEVYKEEAGKIQDVYIKSAK